MAKRTDPMSVIKQAQSKGLFPEAKIETAEEAAELIQDLELAAKRDLDDFALEGIVPLIKIELLEGGTKNYPITYQRLAVVFMDTFARTNEDLTLTPYYNLVSRMLGDIPVPTLRNWWVKKDTISAIAEGVDTKLGDIIIYQLQIHALKMAQALDSIDYVQMLKNHPKVFVELNKLIFMQLRLLKGEATSNKEVIVNHRGAVEMVAPDIAK